MIRVAVIGAGNICNAHLTAYDAFPERCKVAAICDFYVEKAQEEANKHGLTDCRIFLDYHEMLREIKPDLVSVCLPPYVHCEVTIAALEAGANVICEKPMASSLEECDMMIEAEKRTGHFISCVAQNRFTDDHMLLKQIVESGEIGRLVHAQVDSNWWRGHCYYDLWWRGTWEKERGGCTLNHAVHHIDLLLWLMGMPERVTAVLSNACHDNSEVEDVSVAVLEYPGGAVAQVTSSVIAHGQRQGVILQGEKAMVAEPWDRYASTSMSNGFPVENTELDAKLDTMHESFEHLPYKLHTAQIDNVLTAVEKGTKPYITSEDGRRTLELITAIYKAGFAHTTISLPLQKDDPFYTAKGIEANVRHFYEKTGNIENFTKIGFENSTRS